MQNKYGHLFLLLYSLFVFLFNEQPPKLCKFHTLGSCLELRLLICSGECRLWLGTYGNSVFFSQSRPFYITAYEYQAQLAGQVISLKPESREKKSVWFSSKRCYISTANTSHLFIFWLGRQSLIENPQEFRSFWKKFAIHNIKKFTMRLYSFVFILYNFLFYLLHLNPEVEVIVRTLNCSLTLCWKSVL